MPPPTDLDPQPPVVAHRPPRAPAREDRVTHPDSRLNGQLDHAEGRGRHQAGVDGGIAPGVLARHVLGVGPDVLRFLARAGRSLADSLSGAAERVTDGTPGGLPGGCDGSGWAWHSPSLCRW